MKKLFNKLFFILCSIGLLNLLSDKLFLKLRFRCQLGRKLDLYSPKSFNEKLQWLKLNDRKDYYSKLVDKYEVKDYVSNLIGNEYIIPTLGVYDSFDDIDFSKLPNQFVIKCTHDSGSVIICNDINNFDLDYARAVIKKSMKKNYYYSGREWPYKNIKPRIIIEKYMGNQIFDYKFQCFNGKIDHVFVCEGRNTSRGVRYYYFDENWNYLDYCHYDNIDINFLNTLKPDNFAEMVELVSKLCKDFTEIRIDLYSINNEIYFGEYTFYTSSGFDTSITKEADYIIGKRLNIQEKVVK